MSLGTIDHINDAEGKPVWGLQVAPHIAIKVKRMFPRAYQGRTSTIHIWDTEEVARDLEWLLLRYPLDISPGAHNYLKMRADEHRDRETALERILGGERAMLEFREPARPARDYQLQAADMAWRSEGMLLADDVGLGKSMSGLLLLRDPTALPALVVTLTHLPSQWLRELDATLPWLKGHAIKTGKVYDVGDADLLVISYSKLHKWVDYLEGVIKTVIYDEVQELRHAGTYKHDAAVRISNKADRRLGLSATPIHNYGGEVHTVMDVLAPARLGTRQEFLREWGSGIDGPKAKVTDPRALGLYLRDEGLMLRRTRKDVHRELPDPISVVQDVPHDQSVMDAFTGDMVELARLLLDDQATSFDKMRAASEVDWRLRQATGVAKAPFVAEFIRLLLEGEEKVVLYGWHRDVYEMWLKALAPFNPVMYTGTESPAQKDKAAQRFLTDPGCRVFICSLRSGAGLDGLQEVASVCVFGELDWSPSVHHQAIGRLARDRGDGQDATVVAYYLVTDSGSDPVIADVLEVKRQQSEPMVNPHADPLQIAGKDTADRMKMLARAVLERHHGKEI